MDATTTIGAGIALGLRRELHLPETCASFYVLESMHNELFPQTRDNARFKKGLMPGDFGSDSRMERLAYSVQRSLQDLEGKIADEFALYLSVACGGELRHLQTQLGSERRYHCTHSVEHSPRKCCDHSRHSKIRPVCLNKLDCSCVCDHNHRRNCPNIPSGGCRRIAWAVGDGSGFGYCCPHVCTRGKDKCWHTERTTRPTKRIASFLKTLRENGGNLLSGSRDYRRSLGWTVWHELSEGEPATWLRDCAEMFACEEYWRGDYHGYGGEKWALAAHIAADYYDSRIQPRTFLDRCWSMEHNGGCIFNKFYELLPVPSLLWPRSKKNYLQAILDVQAADEYDLLAEHATRYVRDLWGEFSLATGRRTILDTIAVVRARVSSSPRPSSTFWTGCAACLNHYIAHNHKDSCGAHMLDEVWTACRYADDRFLDTTTGLSGGLACGYCSGPKDYDDSEDEYDGPCECGEHGCESCWPDQCDDHGCIPCWGGDCGDADCGQCHSEESEPCGCGALGCPNDEPDESEVKSEATKTTLTTSDLYVAFSSTQKQELVASANPPPNVDWAAAYATALKTSNALKGATP